MQRLGRGVVFLGVVNLGEIVEAAGQARVERSKMLSLPDCCEKRNFGFPKLPLLEGAESGIVLGLVRS